MASDRATLDQIAAELAEMEAVATRSLERESEYSTKRDVLEVLRMRTYRCQGLVQQLRMPPLPAVRDAVDEANAEVGETWD